VFGFFAVIESVPKHERACQYASALRVSIWRLPTKQFTRPKLNMHSLQGVNNNAPMRVQSDPQNYNTTGGYSMYPNPAPY